MKLQPHQMRVVTEKKELDEKIAKLSTFFDGSIFPTLDSEEKQRLSAQIGYMNDYSAVLGARIAAFKK